MAIKALPSRQTRLRVHFWVTGQPVGQPRRRPGRAFGGGFNTYLPKDHKIHGYRGAVAAAAKEAMNGQKPSGLPFSASIRFVLARPKGMRPGLRCWAPVKPDTDNLVKAVYDSVKGIVWQDDKQVVQEFVQKVYAATGEGPIVEVTLEEVPGAPL